MIGIWGMGHTTGNIVFNMKKNWKGCIETNGVLADYAYVHFSLAGLSIARDDNHILYGASAEIDQYKKIMKQDTVQKHLKDEFRRLSHIVFVVMYEGTTVHTYATYDMTKMAIEMGIQTQTIILKPTLLNHKIHHKWCEEYISKYEMESLPYQVVSMSARDEDIIRKEKDLRSFMRLQSQKVMSAIDNYVLSQIDSIQMDSSKKCYPSWEYRLDK